MTVYYLRNYFLFKCYFKGVFFFFVKSMCQIMNFIVTMFAPFHSAVNVEDFLREGMKEIPSLAGAKFSSQDLVDLIGCTNLEAPHRENKKFNILYGNDAVIPSYLLFLTMTYGVKAQMPKRLDDFEEDVP